jgi:hypothetical protein
MWATVLFFALLPQAEPVRERVGEIQLNYVYSDDGKHILTQWIFLDHGQVQAWRMCKGQRIERDYDRGGWVLRFWDGEFYREVRADSFAELHTQYDVEINARNQWPVEQRRELIGGRRTTP